jgi:hypothetical protein
MINRTALTKMGGVVALAASTLAISSSASAVTLFGNYPPTNDNSSNTVDLSAKKAVGFTLPTGSNYTLDSITLRLGDYQSATDNPLLQIYADAAKNSTDPNGAIIQSVAFTKPTSNSDSINNFTFTPTSTFTFSADTRYWLAVSNTSDSFTWRASSPGVTPTGIAGITNNGYRFSANSGTSYGTNSSLLNTFQINATAASATAVPEPTQLAGYAVLLGGIWAGRKLLKSKQQLE